MSERLEAIIIMGIIVIAAWAAWHYVAWYAGVILGTAALLVGGIGAIRELRS